MEVSITDVQDTKIKHIIQEKEGKHLKPLISFMQYKTFRNRIIAKTEVFSAIVSYRSGVNIP